MQYATAAAGHELKNRYIGVKYFMWDIIMIVSSKHYFVILTFFYKIGEQIAFLQDWR